MGRLSGFFALLLSAFLMAPQVFPPPREPQPNAPAETFVPPTPLPTAEPPGARKGAGQTGPTALPTPPSAPSPAPTATVSRVPLVVPTALPASPPPDPEESPIEWIEPAHPQYAQGRDRLYILMFHTVLPDECECNNWAVSVTELRSYLQWLRDHGYTTVLPRQIAAGEALPSRAVMLTFDDGYATNYTLAYPILQEFEAKAVISPVVRCVDEENSDFLTWAQCREMVASGLVEIGSHTYNCHEYDHCLNRLEGESREAYEGRVFPNIDKSVQRIQEELGVPVTFFAYPNGRWDSWSNEYLSHRFTMSVSTTYGTARLSKGLYRLPRYTVNASQPVWAVLPK